MFGSELSELMKYYSIEEVNDKLSELDDATLTKLRKIAGIITYYYNLNPEDLLQDVFDKLLSEKRRWPKDLDISVFFKNTMKSILSNEKKKDQKVLSLHSTNENGDELVNTIPDKRIDIEQGILLDQEIKAILNLFEDDVIAKDLVEGRMENLKKSELLELTGLNEKEYDTKWKKIRRRIAKKYSGGWRNEQ
ncbi:MAG TPA: hypothetical protein ENH85_15690 [Candidatus Scalindua sp.]|nr:hypothetical protein [Candidatus Scalindua sp.]